MDYKVQLSLSVLNMSVHLFVLKSHYVLMSPVLVFVVKICFSVSLCPQEDIFVYVLQLSLSVLNMSLCLFIFMMSHVFIVLWFVNVHQNVLKMS